MHFNSWSYMDCSVESKGKPWCFVTNLLGPSCRKLNTLKLQFYQTNNTYKVGGGILAYCHGCLM